MSVSHLEFLVEEPSAEAFLQRLLPHILPSGCSFEVRTFQGKGDLIKNLLPRLRGYAAWMPSDWRIVVLVDRDDDDCITLKGRMEEAAKDSGLGTRNSPIQGGWRVVNRIAIEELEAWYFGDWGAVQKSFPGVPRTIPEKAPFRNPDSIKGGTWEAFERILKAAGHHQSGLRKVEAARLMGEQLRPDACTSPSFRQFHRALASISSGPRSPASRSR